MMRNWLASQPLLVDLKWIASMLGISLRTARRLVNQPGFPRRVRMRRCVRWWKAEVLDFVRSKCSP